MKKLFKLFVTFISCITFAAIALLAAVTPAIAVDGSYVLTLGQTQTSDAGTAGLQDVVLLWPGRQTASINGVKQSIGSTPYIKNGTTMVPLRFICQDVLKAEVAWNNTTKEVKVTDGTATVLLQIKEGKIWQNGIEYIMPVLPAVKEGYTYVPLRLIAELFSCQVDFAAKEKKISIITPQREVAIPIASFTLPEVIVQGQVFSYTNSSYDSQGAKISQYLWELELAGSITQTADITEFFKNNPQAGIYNVKLKVKNTFGVWSNWAQGSIEILANHPPTVSNLKPNMYYPNIGQDVTFTYDIGNENWEDVTELSWSYTYKDANGRERTINALPRVFFAGGTTKVSLKAKDAYGNWSEECSIDVFVNGTVTMSEYAYKFTKLVAGDYFLNVPAYNYNLVKTAPITSISYNDVTLLVSNNPERFTGPELMYRDKASGKVRIYYYHHSESAEKLYLLVCAQNNTKENITLQINKKTVVGPDSDGMYLGQVLNQRYFTDDLAYAQTTLNPGQKICLAASQRALKTGEVSTGLVELTCSGPLLFTVEAAPTQNGLAGSSTVSVAQKEGSHVRGTFSQANIQMNIAAEGVNIEKIIIDRQDVYEGYFRTGVDAATGETVTNVGNRGVIQTITISATRAVGVIFNPRGSIYKGALYDWNKKICFLANTGILKGSQEGVIVGVIEAGETKTITYTAPGGSDAVALFILVPKYLW